VLNVPLEERDHLDEELEHVERVEPRRVREHADTMVHHEVGLACRAGAHALSAAEKQGYTRSTAAAAARGHGEMPWCDPPAHVQIKIDTPRRAARSPEWSEADRKTLDMPMYTMSTVGAMTFWNVIA
jgi:hypothetical protein